MSLQGAGAALVIGGASGIGAALVARYRDESIPVTVWDVDGSFDVHCDIADPDQIVNALQTTQQTSGLPRHITITAGIGHSGLLTDISADQWDHVFDVNTRGPWLCMRALAGALMDAGQPASMVATSSVSAHLVDRNMGAYCASKAALSMLVKVAAAEWGPAGIRVNAVAPGVTKTPMLGGARPDSPWLTGVSERTTLGRLGESEDVAQAIVALHGMEWVTGQILDCDGGLSLQSPINSYSAVRRAQPGSPP